MAIFLCPLKWSSKRSRKSNKYPSRFGHEPRPRTGPFLSAAPVIREPFNLLCTAKTGTRRNRVLRFFPGNPGKNKLISRSGDAKKFGSTRNSAGCESSGRHPRENLSFRTHVRNLGHRGVNHCLRFLGLRSRRDSTGSVHGIVPPVELTSFFHPVRP